MATINKHSWGAVKPPLGAQIDWGHPLSNGLHHVWLFQRERNVNNEVFFPIELVNGITKSSPAGAPSRVSAWRWSPFGDAAYFDNGTPIWYLGREKDQIVTNHGEMTVAALVSANSTGASGLGRGRIFIFEADDTLENGGLSYNDTGADPNSESLFFATPYDGQNNVVLTEAGFLPADKQYYWVFGTWKSNTSKDGSEFAMYRSLASGGKWLKATLTGSQSGVGNYYNPPHVVLANRSSDTARSWDGNIVSLIMWHRQLTVGEMQGIVVHPWQFIQAPSTRQYFLMGQAEAQVQQIVRLLGQAWM